VFTVIPRKRPAAVPGLARHTASNLWKGTLREGPDAVQFEAALSERLEGRHVRAVGSGRLALLLVLDALDIQPPATVILPSYTASCVPNVLQAAGYTLFFVDIDRDTLHLAADLLPDTAPEGTRALLATHIEGSPVDIGPLLDWAGSREIAVIEDAAHALGATLADRPVGALGDAAIFSLGRGKHLNTLGGGLAVVSTPEAAERLDMRVDSLPCARSTELLRSVVMEGMIETGTAPALFGTLAMPVMKVARRFGADPMTRLFEDDKSPLAAIPEPMRRRLSNLQARFGLEALREFHLSLDRRRGHAKALRLALGDHLNLQTPVEGGNPAWLELTAQVEDRDAFQSALLSRGVDTQRTWMDACADLPAFESALGGACPVAREVAARAVYLPTYAALSDRQRQELVHHVLDVMVAVDKDAV
jgi:dTDP-4-amino-4,6-dideoxygalactose transaminase